MTRVYLTEDAGGVTIEELKEKLLVVVKANEGITSVQIAEKAGVDQAFVDALLAELQRERKVVLYT